MEEHTIEHEGLHRIVDEEGTEAVDGESRGDSARIRYSLPHIAMEAMHFRAVPVVPFNRKHILHFLHGIAPRHQECVSVVVAVVRDQGSSLLFFRSGELFFETVLLRHQLACDLHQLHHLTGRIASSVGVLRGREGERGVRVSRTSR